DADHIAEGIELNHAVLLGAVVGGPLGGGQLEEDVLHDLGRHVGGDILLDAAQDGVARQLAENIGGSVGRNAAGVDEGEDVGEVVHAIFDGSAGHGPAAVAGNAADDLRGFCLAVL